MNTTTFETFQADALAAGFDEVLERRWAPDTVIATHTHAFGVEAVVTQGEMWLTCEGHTRHLTPGGVFTLEPEVPHDERYGAGHELVGFIGIASLHAQRPLTESALVCWAGPAG